LPEAKQPYEPDPRARQIERVLDGHDRLMDRVAEGHTPEFLEIAVTMPQAKVLYLVSVPGGLRMSALAARMGVTLSTVSGVVDRLVESGLATRREDSADRRHVVVGCSPAGIALMERFREFNRRNLRGLLDRLTDTELEAVERAYRIMATAAERVAESFTQPTETTDAADRADTVQGDHS
jgi:DNA-binding MarR family transcriptional regulator